MEKKLRLLGQVKVASPCPANWDEMSGDDRSRFCSQCRLKVHNLSGLTDQEAEALLRGASGRLCVRYYERTDGKVMTRDCPRGLRAVRQHVARRLVLAAAFVLTCVGCGPQGDKYRSALGLGILNQPKMGRMVMGAIAATPPPTGSSGVSAGTPPSKS